MPDGRQWHSIKVTYMGRQAWRILFQRIDGSVWRVMEIACRGHSMEYVAKRLNDIALHNGVQSLGERGWKNVAKITMEKPKEPFILEGEAAI